MNGRIFDPTLARFASADPHIQHAGNMQSYNRYSYVLNNPLIHTDPTGFFLKKLFKGVKKLFKKILKNPIVRAVAAIAVGVVTRGAAASFVAGKLGFSSIAAATIGATATLNRLYLWERQWEQ